MGMTKAFHPLPLEQRGFHGLKPNLCKISLIDIALLEVVSAMITDAGIDPLLVDEITKKGVMTYIAQDGD